MLVPHPQKMNGDPKLVNILGFSAAKNQTGVEIRLVNLQLGNVYFCGKLLMNPALPVAVILNPFPSSRTQPRCPKNPSEPT